MNFHDFTVKNLKGESVNLSDYKGKVVMVVNTATQCGYTPQLAELEELYKSYKDQGFEVLGFPSNDFMGQEPLEGEAIQEFCDMRYRTTFPLFEKMHVKGPEASELFQFLSDKKKNGTVGSSPKWNFQKYVIDKDGQVSDFFYTITSPTSSRVKSLIEKLLKK